MAKVKTHEEAVAALEAAKENSKTARTALREFKAENGIKKGKDPEDAKVKKEYDKLNAAVEKTSTALEEAKAAEKELRPKKERTLKYEYPEGMSDADKKKYRAKMRREAKAATKAAEKAEKGENTEKSEKPAKGEEKPKPKAKVKVKANKED